MRKAAVAGSFDNLRSQHVRFLEEASRFGEVHVFLWSDKVAQSVEGKVPRFPEQERAYLVQSMRYVKDVVIVRSVPTPISGTLLDGIQADILVSGKDLSLVWQWPGASSRGAVSIMIDDDKLLGFPAPTEEFEKVDSATKRVVVSGCFDWFHSGHVRFFEEASEFGQLHVVVGHDANVRLLKGEGHPLFPQEERRYMIQAVKYVNQAWISSGKGWMDAEPEIAVIQPHYYIVNEDGDVPEKRTFCESRGIEYIVLKRKPREGLPRRQSTDLRGF